MFFFQTKIKIRLVEKLTNTCFHKNCSITCFVLKYDFKNVLFHYLTINIFILGIFCTHFNMFAINF